MLLVAGLSERRGSCRRDMNFLLYEKLGFVSGDATESSFIANAGNSEVSLLPDQSFP